MLALARLAIRRPVAVTVLAATVALLGFAAWDDLPVDLLPDIESPTVVVSLRSGSRPPVEMEWLYGEQIEQRLFAVRGIRDVTQVARTGRLVATVTFGWDADMDLALVDVQKALSGLSGDPEVDEVLIRRFDPRQSPVLSIGLFAPTGTPDLVELRRVARRQIAPGLERLDGVAEARILGGREREVRVTIDRYRMEAYGLTLADVESRIRAANLDVAAGTLEEEGRVFVVRGLSRFRTPEDVARAVVGFREGAQATPLPVRVGDIADVGYAEAEYFHLVRVNGREGVGVSIYKEAGANTVDVAREVRTALLALSRDLPGVEALIASDESALVEEAIAGVERAALFGIVLALGVLVLFLRAVGPVLVVGIAIPVSLLATLFLLLLRGESLNVMTLGGLALGAGMLVDNAIVVMESIFRAKGEGRSVADAAAYGTGAVGGAIFASTLTTCAVFLPIVFVEGLAARLVEGLAFTVVISLAASLVVAIFVVPALAAWFLPRSRTTGIAAGAAWIERFVARALRARLAVVALGIAAALLGAWGLRSLGTELLPPADPLELTARLVGPPGQRVEATARAAAVLEGALRAAGGDDITVVLAEVGRLPEDDRTVREEQTEENTARITARLRPGGLAARTLVSRVAPAVEGLAGHQIEWESGASALARALGTGGAPIVVEVSGVALGDLRRAADDVAARLRAEPALWNVRSSFEGGPPELRVALDRTMADALGVDLEVVSRVLESALDGRVVTALSTGDEEYDIVLRTGAVRREDLGSLRVALASGTRLALGDIATFEPESGAREIFRRDQRRIARVTARVAAGAEYPDARAGAMRALEGVTLAPGLRASLVGEEVERARAFEQLTMAFAFALVLVFLVLAGTFESVLHPVTVLAVVPLALAGVALTLVPAGQPVGIVALLGVITLSGIAVNNAILFVDSARSFIAEGIARREALAKAAGVRLRPILMTTATTILALVPLAFGRGEDVALRAPLALTIVGGLAASTVASLVFVPCLYDLIESVRDGVRRKSA